MKIEEARIAAHVCADGWKTTFNENNSLQIVNGRKYRRLRKRYEIGYSNKNRKLLDEFSIDASKVYGVKRKFPKRNEIRIRSKRIFDRLDSLGARKTYNWFVSDEILNSNNLVKSNWLRAFFDDEGTVELKSGRIRVKSMNKKGLIQTSCLLNELQVGNSMNYNKSDCSWYITIPRKNAEIFMCRVGFLHPGKKSKLIKIVNGSKEN